MVLIHSQLFAQRGLADCTFILPDTSFDAPMKKLPFASITVTDVRFDTTKLGYLTASIKENERRICLSNAGKQIGSYLTDHYASDSVVNGEKIFAFIKKLWIDDVGVDSVRYGFFFKIEYYLNREECFYPLYRFDTAMVMHGELSTWGTWINKGLIASARKLFHTNQVNLDQLKCYSLRQIDSFNYAPKNIPILTERILRKGVYLSFYQFKNNKPAYRDFGINADEDFDILYVQGKNLKDSAINDAWGFCDGSKLFIRVGQNFYPLHRVDHNFEYYGIDKTGNHSRFPYSPGSRYLDPLSAGIDMGFRKLMSRIETDVERLSLYQLDMETGRSTKLY